MNLITSIRPISDADAARAVSDEALAELAERITSMPVRRSRRRARGSRTSRRAGRGPLRLGFAAAVLVAAVLLLTGSFGGGGGSVGLGPASAQALMFRHSDGFTIVTVRDPLADPARYRAELAAHHLDITLKLAPVSPSLVGALVYFDGSDQIKPITAVGKCFTPGGGDKCPVGARIPSNYHGAAELMFGRAARPGEQYVSSGDATAPGEALHGVRYRGKTVATVLAILHARHYTVAQFRLQRPGSSDPVAPDRVPGDWYVDNAMPWAAGQVLLWVSPTVQTTVGSPQPAQ